MNSPERRPNTVRGVSGQTELALDNTRQKDGGFRPPEELLQKEKTPIVGASSFCNAFSID
jgi:hypothetical protein